MADSRLRVVIEAINQASAELESIKSDLSAVAKETDSLADSQLRAADSASEMTDEVKAVGEATQGTTDANSKGVGSFTELSSAIGLAKQAYQVLQQVYGATITPTLELASAQRELALAGQISVEEAGQLIQVADDLKISSDQLKTAFKAMTQDGLQPSIANIKAVAAQYQAAESPTEKLKVAQDGLGRSYQDLLPLLELTPEKIDEMAQAASAAGLVMSTEAVQAARDYELAIDELTDSWGAFVTKVGNEGIPILTAAVDAVNQNNERVRLAEEAYRLGAISYEDFLNAQANTSPIEMATSWNERLKAAIEGASAGLVPYTSYTREWADTTLYAAQAQERNAAAIKATHDAMINLPQVWRDAKASLDGLNISTAKKLELEQLIALHSGQMTADSLLQQESVRNLTEQLNIGAITQDEYFAKLQELAAGAITVRTSFEEMGHGTVIFSAEADKVIPKITKTTEEVDKQTKAVDLATVAVSGYGSMLAAQNDGTEIYDFVVGLSKITGEALAVGAAIRGIPSLPGGNTGGANTTGGGGIRSADGLHMTVPAGYPNDSFGPIWAQTGENINIDKPGESSGVGNIYNFYAYDELDMEVIARRVTEIQQGRG